ncbi:MAG: VOC family protein [Fimbriimonadaceae bacterium]|nr:VOC family protein [Fimbriimonadaceae bacterium]
MSFQLSKCIGLTVPNPDEAALFYESWLGINPTHTRDGLQLVGGGLTFYIDPGQRRQPLLEFLTEDLKEARPILRSLGFQEEVWYGPGKLNMVADPFGIQWNVYQEIPDEPWPVIDIGFPPIPAKIGLHIHEIEKAAQFYADLFEESATKTPSGWTIDSNGIRLIIEDGIPPGPIFFVDTNAEKVEMSVLNELFGTKSTAVDDFGTPWKVVPHLSGGKAVISSSEA